MKLTLGAKLSILIALIVSGTWFLIFFAGDAMGGNLPDYLGLMLVILSFPIAQLSGMFSHTGTARQSELWWYLILMVPNCFLIGYSLSALIWFFGKIGHICGYKQDCEPNQTIDENGEQALPVRK